MKPRLITFCYFQVVVFHMNNSYQLNNLAITIDQKCVIVMEANFLSYINTSTHQRNQNQGFHRVFESLQSQT